MTDNTPAPEQDTIEQMLDSHADKEQAYIAEKLALDQVGDNLQSLREKAAGAKNHAKDMDEERQAHFQASAGKIDSRQRDLRRSAKDSLGFVEECHTGIAEIEPEHLDQQIRTQDARNAYEASYRRCYEKIRERDFDAALEALATVEEGRDFLRALSWVDEKISRDVAADPLVGDSRFAPLGFEPERAAKRAKLGNNALRKMTAKAGLLISTAASGDQQEAPSNASLPPLHPHSNHELRERMSPAKRGLLRKHGWQFLRVYEKEGLEAARQDALARV